MTIRIAGPEDQIEVQKIIAAAYSPYVEELGQPLGTILDGYLKRIERREVFVLEVKGRLIGVVFLRVADIGYMLESVAVGPQFQHMGTGQLLMNFAEREAVSRGFSQIHLNTQVGMTRNRRIYRQRGYVEGDVVTEKGVHRVYMTKHLG